MAVKVPKSIRSRIRLEKKSGIALLSRTVDPRCLACKDKIYRKPGNKSDAESETSEEYIEYGPYIPTLIRLLDSGYFS